MCNDKDNASPNSKSNNIKFVIISHNFTGYNGDDYYEIEINNLEDIDNAKQEEDRISDRDRCMYSESYFLYEGKKISESEVRKLLSN